MPLKLCGPYRTTPVVVRGMIAWRVYFPPSVILPKSHTPGSQSPLESDTPGCQSPPECDTPGSQSPPECDTPGIQSPLECDTPRSQSPPECDSPGSPTPPESKTLETISPRSDSPGSQIFKLKGRKPQQNQKYFNSLVSGQSTRGENF